MKLRILLATSITAGLLATGGWLLLHGLAAGAPGRPLRWRLSLRAR